ncbi:MAG: PQQ-like beta-propeller repeat protein [Planctomycetes bacterium]|jgi:hypothetical protein|nr:PQQ-like beta-propeller repeat protein [Planctomycetota bacterium]
MARNEASTALLLLVSLLPSLAAQTVIKVKHGDTPSPLQQHIAELLMPARRSHGIAALLTIGAPAVPLLAAEVERATAAAPVALAVLERLGGEAAAAAPVLRRVAAAAANGPWRDRLLRVTAALDGPPCILVCLHEGNAVVQVDFDGNTVREIKCEDPWGAWPLPGDQLGVLSYKSGKAGVWTWDGTLVESQAVGENATLWLPLDDGDHIRTSWQRDGVLSRVAPDGTARWEVDVSAIRLQHSADDELFVVTRDEPSLRSFTMAGESLRTVPLPSRCHGFRLLPDGNVVLAAHADDKVIELDPAGKVVREFAVAEKPTDVHRLHDGRTVVACGNGLVLLAADGSEQWRQPLGSCGPLFVRAPVSTSPAPSGPPPAEAPSGR